MIRACLALTALVFSAPAVMAEGIKPSDEAPVQIGPTVGDQVADFAAIKANGEAVTLADISAASGSVLVFSRSLDWCPFCKVQATDLIAAAAPLAELGWSLNVITYDPPETLTAFADKNDTSYTLLSDTGSAMINALGLRNHDMPKGSKYDGVPHPAILFLSPSGEVLAMLREEGYKNRPPVETVLSTAKALNSAG
jgi:peroxiredoxin